MAISDIKDTSLISLRVSVEASEGALATAPLFRNVQTQSLGDAFATVTSLDESTEIGGDGLPSKGFPTDQESAADFTSYLNQSEVNDIFLQLYTNNTWSEKATVIGINANANTTITTVTATTIVATGTTFSGFRTNDLVFLENFASAGNNGRILRVTAATGTTLTFASGTGLTAETNVNTASPRANVTVVGYQFGDPTVSTDRGQLSLVVPSTGYPYLNRVAGTKAFSQFGLQEGEVIIIGDDDSTDADEQRYYFGGASGSNQTWARVHQVDTTNNRIYLDESGDTLTAGSETGKTIRLFFGRCVKTPDDPTDYVNTYLQFEMPMGSHPGTPANTQAQYTPGAVPNTLTLTLPNPAGTEGAITAAYNFITSNFDYRDSLKTRTLLSEQNHESNKYLSNNILRYNRIYQPDEEGARSTFPSSLASVIASSDHTIDLSTTGMKGQGRLGTFTTAKGTFSLTGNMTLYFEDFATRRLLEDATSVGHYYGWAYENRALFMNVPRSTLGITSTNTEVGTKLQDTYSYRAHKYRAHTDTYALAFTSFPYSPDYIHIHTED